jgi:hypothetical protein
MNNKSNDNSEAAKCSQDDTSLHANFVWRNTQEDGFMPFINMGGSYGE